MLRCSAEQSRDGAVCASCSLNSCCGCCPPASLTQPMHPLHNASTWWQQQTTQRWLPCAAHLHRRRRARLAASQETFVAADGVAHGAGHLEVVCFKVIYLQRRVEGEEGGGGCWAERRGWRGGGSESLPAAPAAAPCRGAPC